eukprot:scaffold1018_cov59-Phaeocystis_antarctica.AAC.3
MVRGAGRALRPGDLDAARQGYMPLRAAVVYIQRAHSLIYTHTQQQTARPVSLPARRHSPRQPSTADPYRLGLATASSVLLAGRRALAALRLRHVLVEEEQHQHEGGGVAAAHRGERDALNALHDPKEPAQLIAVGQEGARRCDGRVHHAQRDHHRHVEGIDHGDRGGLQREGAAAAQDGDAQ